MMLQRHAGRACHALTVVLVWLLPTTVFAQEDAFHTSLRTELQNTYGVTGGSWIFSGNETTDLQNRQGWGCTFSEFDVVGQPFSLGTRADVAAGTIQFWSATIRYLSEAPVNAGDVILLAASFRSVNSEIGSGSVKMKVEKATAPYTASLVTGMEVTTSWQRMLVPFVVEETYAAGGFSVNFQIAQQQQVIEIGGVAMINYGSSYTVADLPSQGTTYEGRSLTAPWRAEAESRIEQLRKGTFNVAVVDGMGNPVDGATVQVKMKSHEFGFGTAVNTWALDNASQNTYRDKLENLAGGGKTFSTSVLESAMKWRQWIGGRAEPAKEAVEWLNERGITIRGHNGIWGGYSVMPDYMPGLDQASARDSVLTHARRIAGDPLIKGHLTHWDVVNEPVHVRDLATKMNGYPGYPADPDGEMIYSEIWQNMRQTEDEPTKYINDYNIITEGGALKATQNDYRRVIVNLGMNIEGIGFQGHFSYPLTGMTRLKAIFDEFAAFDVPIAITELDMKDVDVDLAGEYIRDVVTLLFSHPAAESFLVWGFVDSYHWLDDAPFFYSDWTPKPAGQAFIDLVFNEWWTDASGQTASGSYSTSGFYGDYEVTVTSGGETVVRNVSFLKGRETVEVQIGSGADQIVQDFEDLPADRWGALGDSGSTCEAGITAPGYHGKRAMVYNYDVSNVGGNNYCSAGTTLTPQDWSGGAGLGMWIRTAKGPVNVPTIELIDNGGERFVAPWSNPFTEWTWLELPWDAFSRSDNQPAGAPNDGLTLTAVEGYLVNYPANKKGTLYIDDITLLGSAGVDVALETRVAVMGAFNGSGMRTDLNSDGLIPLQQPFGQAPYAYGGSESVPSIPADVVDWVLIELAPESGGRSARRACFVNATSDVVDLDGASPCLMRGVPSGTYRVVVRHQNHLAVQGGEVVVP